MSNFLILSQNVCLSTLSKATCTVERVVYFNWKRHSFKIQAILYLSVIFYRSISQYFPKACFVIQQSKYCFFSCVHLNIIMSEVYFCCVEFMVENSTVFIVKVKAGARSLGEHHTKFESELKKLSKSWNWAYCCLRLNIIKAHMFILMFSTNDFI